jgi:hypothetical protein
LAGVLFAVHPIHTEAVSEDIFILFYFCSENNYPSLLMNQLIKLPIIPKKEKKMKTKHNYLFRNLILVTIFFFLF